MNKPLFPLLLSLGLIGIYCLFLLSLGTFNLNQPFFLSRVFENMWENLSQFSLAVDAQILGREGFEINGITTAYFLPFPSLIRGTLSSINLGHSAILSVWLGAMTFFCAALLIWNHLFSKTTSKSHAWSWLLWIFGITLCTFMSPMLGIMTYPTVFWEAIVWASALFLLASFFSMRVIDQGGKNQRTFLAFSLICGLALFTRATFSFATCLLYGFSILLLLKSQWRSRDSILKNISQSKILLINVVIFGTCVCLLLLFNYAKWGNPFEFYSLQHYKMWDEEGKLKFKEHGALDIARIPETFFYYFVPSVDNFLNYAPFIKLGNSNAFGKATIFDYKEPALPILITQPISTVLFFSGFFFVLVSLYKYKKTIFTSALPSLFCSLIPLVLILSIHSLSIRYVGDFLPALMLFPLVLLSQFNHLFQSNPSDSKPLPYLPKLSGLCFIGLTAIVSVYLSTAGVFLQNQLWRNLFHFTLIPMEIGETVSFANFGQNTKAVGFLQKGWATDLESFGTWSNSKTSNLLVLLPPKISHQNYLSIQAKAFLPPNQPNQQVDIFIDEKFYQSIMFSNSEVHDIIIKPSVINRSSLTDWAYMGKRAFNQLASAMGTINQDPLAIQFHIHHPARPKDHGINNDDRLLGLGLISISLY